jgi:hypothetical protein
MALAVKPKAGINYIHMKQLCIVLIFATTFLTPALSKNGGNPFAGRWDITVTTPNVTYPVWMECVEKGGNPEVRVQPRRGSVRPAAGIKMEGSRLTLTVSAASPTRPAVAWELSVKGGRLTGTEKRGDAVAGQLTGVRAPALKRKPPKAWTSPEALFNGKDLTGWEPDKAANNHWKVQDGALANEKKGANLRTTRKFDDFKLHFECDCQEGSNSGVYLRGRYEVQIECEPRAEENDHTMGAIYGVLAPAAKAPRRPGQWDSFDITLVGRYVTIVRNGVTTIDNQEIPGITGGALDSNEGLPGSFYVQGDHSGGMQYRNITVSVPKR